MLRQNMLRNSLDFVSELFARHPFLAYTVGTMKSALTVCLLLSFAVAAIFGVFAMGHSAGTHEGCIAAISQNALCPLDAISFVNFHVEFFKSFSSAVFNFDILALLSLVFALFVMLRAIARDEKIVERTVIAFAYIRTPLTAFQKKLRWLAFHENSPAHI